MKKFFIIASVACMGLSSCSFFKSEELQTKTTHTQNVNVTNLYTEAEETVENPKVANTLPQKLHIKTANTLNVSVNPILANLIISEEKITHEYLHDTNGDINNAKECAIYDALKKYGNADVLVAPQFDVELDNGVKKVVVSGYPAKYKNFRNSSISSVSENYSFENAAKTTINLPSTAVNKITASVQTGGKDLFVATFEQNDNMVVAETITPVETQEETVQPKKEKTTKKNKVKKVEVQKEVVQEETTETTYNVSEDTLNSLKKKAKANDAKAQYELGCYYWLDLGLTSRGKKWLKKAAEQGYQPAIEKLNELNQY